MDRHKKPIFKNQRYLFYQMVVNSIVLISLGITDTAVIVSDRYTKGYCRTSG
jgi:hypothetical protein